MNNKVVPGDGGAGEAVQGGPGLCRAGQVQPVQVSSTAIDIRHLARGARTLMPPRQTRAGCDMRRAAPRDCLGQATARADHCTTASPSYVSAFALAHARGLGATPWAVRCRGRRRQKWEAEQRGEKRSRWARITNDAPAIRQGLDKKKSLLTKAGVARHV